MYVEDKVIEILKGICFKENISAEDNLYADLGIESLGLVNLLLMIEDTFDIELNGEDMNPYELVTVSDVVKLVEKYVNEETENEVVESNKEISA